MAGAKHPWVRTGAIGVSAFVAPLAVGIAYSALRIRQAEEKLASGLGTAWGDPRWPDLIFTNEAGRCLDAPNLLKRHFHPLLARAGLPIIRFHDLRHTAATLMLLKRSHSEGRQ